MPQQPNGERAPLLGNGSATQDTGTWHTEDPRSFVKYPARLARTTWQVLASNYVNVLLVFVPAGIIAGALGLNPTTVFILNFFAIVPLASLLSFATEELAAKLGETIGGLMNASFGNAVELIVRIARPKYIIGMALTRIAGQHRSSPEGRDSHRSSQHARQCSLQYSPCK